MIDAANVPTAACLVMPGSRWKKGGCAPTGGLKAHLYEQENAGTTPWSSSQPKKRFEGREINEKNE